MENIHTISATLLTVVILSSTTLVAFSGRITEEIYFEH